MEEDELFFDKFWELSSLDKFNVQQFAQQLNSYNSDDKELFLEFPHEPTVLPIPSSRVNKVAKSRKSDRTFSGKELSLKEFGLILSSFYAWNGLEHRGYPSAGATYVTEVFGVAFNVEKYSGKILYYDPEKHGVVVVSYAASWKDAEKSLNMSIDGMPNLLLVFVTFPKRAIAKYGERGGRFALLEAGAAMQQLSLQIANSSKMKGVAVGGILDEYWKQQLKLDRTDARITLGYLIGK